MAQEDLRKRAVQAVKEGKTQSEEEAIMKQLTELQGQRKEKENRLVHPQGWKIRRLVYLQQRIS